MKRFALLFLLCVLVKAQDTTTINLGLTKMGHHTHLGDWDLIYNSNFDKLDRVALPSVDARNLTGVDCAGSSDSSTALNALSANGTTFDATHTIIPKGCRLKVSASKGWTIQNHIGFGISGLSSPGGGGTPSIGTPTLSYCGDGAAGSAVLNLQRTHSPTIENLLIDGKGSGCANGALNGIVMDISGAGTTNGTFGVFRNVQINAGSSGHNANFVGMNFSPTQGSNIEDILIDHSFLYGQQATLGTETSTGILFNTFNTKNEQVINSDFSGWGTAINLGPGGVRVSGGDFANNTIALSWGGNADPTVIDNITSESDAQVLTTPGGGGGHFPVLLANSHFSPGGVAAANKCTISLGDSTNDAEWTIFNNGWDDPSTYSGVTGAFPLCSNHANHLTMINNNLFGGRSGINALLKPTGPSDFIMPNGHEFGADWSWLHGGYMRMGAADAGGSTNIGYGFFSRYGMDVNAVSYSVHNTANDCQWSGGSCWGTDVGYLFGGNLTFANMASIPIEAVTCVTVGTSGAVNYRVRVFPVDAAGKKTGQEVSAGNIGVCGGFGTFDGTHTLTVSWPTVTRAVTYDVVLMNPAASTTQGWLAGNTASTSLAINSGTPSGNYTYVFPGFADSVQTVIQGELLTLNTTSVNGNGTGLKHKRVTGCTTGATLGNTCTTTVTWTTAFADASYTPVCMLLGPATLGHLAAISTDVIVAASVKVETVTDTNAAISGTINCIAIHD